MNRLTYFTDVPSPPGGGDRLARSEGINPPLPTRAQGAAAFTLLEVILAVTIAGALLAGAATLMVSVTNAWLARQDRHFFEDHVDGVTEFLQASFSAAGTEIALDNSAEDTSTGTGNGDTGSENDERESSITIETPTPGDDTSRNSDRDTTNTESNASGGGLIHVSEDPIGWGKPPGYADYQDPLIQFGLKDTPPLLIQNDDAPVIGIQAFLHFERNEGLSLLWYTPLQEESEDINDLRRTPISDLVKEIQYIYWDDRFEGWEEDSEAREGEGEDEFILPRFLKLIFEYEGETKERLITIPVPSTKALLF